MEYTVLRGIEDSKTYVSGKTGISVNFRWLSIYWEVLVLMYIDARSCILEGLIFTESEVPKEVEILDYSTLLRMLYKRDYLMT